jgi:signal peptidase I
VSAERDRAAPNPAGETARRGRGPRRGISGLLRETVLILGGAIVLSLVIKTFLAQAFFIPSASMQDTLVEGDRVVVSKLTPGLFEIERGDVVVFKDPGGWLAPVPAPPTGSRSALLNDVLSYIGLLPPDAGEHLIKRVVGLPGDRVACCDDDGRLMVNGVSVVEPYLKPGSAPSEVDFDVAVPASALFVMGDNRQNSQDSRAHLGDPGGGMVPVDDVVGKAVVVMWPLDRAALLRDPSATFAGVATAAP